MPELLRRLVNAVSPSGDEWAVREIVKKAITPYVDEITTDTLGNLICHKKGKGQALGIAAHMDEVGLMVDRIDPDGYLKVAAIGGIDAITLVGQKVYILNNKNQIICNGVITFEDIQNGENPIDYQVPELEELYVDIGLTKEQCAKKNIDVGCYVVPHHDYAYLGNKNIISGKALDDRIGCYILVELARKLKKFNSNVYFIFTVQEEVGLYGAKTSIYNLDIDWGIAVDVVSANDGALGMPRVLGQGPVITIKDSAMIASRSINLHLEALAKKNKIPIQKEVTSTGTTDALNIMLSKGGIASTVIGVAVRNIHSTVGIADLTDVNHTIELLYLLLKNQPIFEKPNGHRI